MHCTLSSAVRALCVALLCMGWMSSWPLATAPAAKEAAAQVAKPFNKPSPTEKPAGPPAAGPPAPSDVPPPYEPQLLRLAELLGALAYLQDLCGGHQGDVWRIKMAALLDAEAKTQVRRERLAGAFNRGFQGYALTYRACTTNAQAIIDRFLDESGRIARDVARQYGPS